ncbi:biotin carboxylase [Aestuariivirga sp.]|uniref:biotin carboxylase n=1 Tax=Aestuariivirga sp. TaxID=2650926 RepID=UPI00391A7495
MDRGRTARTRLKSLSQIYAYFRQNHTPITFLSPTPYNLLGLGRWINKFEYINFFDSFDGTHPKITVPREHGPHDFRSIEDVNNYLLRHKEVRAALQQRGPGYLLLVMFDEETEALARELGQKIALPPARLRKHFDSKITTTKLGNAAGISSAPNTMGRARSYAELTKLASTARLGSDLVVQTPYGDSGRTTFFIRSEADWKKHEDLLAKEELKVMRRINHLPGTVEAVATRHGTLVGPLQTDITGFAEVTPYKGGWCGNDVFTGGFESERKAVTKMAQKLGDQLYKEGYKGAFCMDFLIDTDTRKVYLGEINPRVSGASPMTNLITSTYGGCPIYMFHLLEFMDVEWELDLSKIQQRWAEFDNWSQLILKYPVDRVEMITKAPPSGIWRMDAKGEISLVRKSIDWFLVSGEDEAFYLRVYTAGDYRYHGADMGILVSRGRFQTDDRKLTPRALAWVEAIHRQFEAIPVSSPSQPVAPPLHTANKMF